MIKLGQQAKDKITGFKGTVVARIEYLNGCIRLEIQPKELQDNGQPVETCFFDEVQCIPQQEPINDKPAEGPRKNPPSMRHQI